MPKLQARVLRVKVKILLSKAHIHMFNLPEPEPQQVLQVLKWSLPTLENLKKKVSIQQLVEDRIKELQHISKTGTDPKLKSPRGGQVEVLVKNRVKWPHEYVLAGNKERVTYDQLTMGQWVAGFCRTMSQTKILRKPCVVI